LLAGLSSHAVSEEQTKPAKDTPAKSRLRTGKQAIEAALVEKTDLDVKELPLEEVVRRLRMKHHLQIVFDINALKDAAIDPTALPVSLQVKDISLRSALKLVLSQFNLTYVIQDEVLQITTKDKANQLLKTTVYDVRDVLPSGEKNRPDFDALIDLITSTIGTQSWSDVGGPGSITGLEPESLVISQIYEVHEEIDYLLRTLRQANEQTKVGKFEDAGLSQLSDNARAILKALEETADLDFHETPLQEVAEQIQKQHRIQIHFDANALKDAAIDNTTIPVTYSVKGVSLRAALNGILSPSNLTCVVQDEVLQITTKDKANQMLDTKLYLIEDLVGRTGDATTSEKRMTPDAESFMDVMTSNVAAQSWSSVGGPGAVEPYDKNGLILVVSQTQQVHEEIADLLSQLRDVHRKQKDDTKADDKPPDPNALVLRVYDLRASVPGAPAMAPQEVMEVVKTLVEPKSWGQGDAYIRGATGRLIVRQTPGIQVAVKKLLDELGASALDSGGVGKGGSKARRGQQGGIPVVGGIGGGGGMAGGKAGGGGF
jgi:hypothetical protein